MLKPVLFLLGILLTCSCNKSSEFDSLHFVNSLNRYVQNNKESFIINDASKAFHLTTSNGTYHKFKANSFGRFNDKFNGKVRIDITEIFSKTDMIVAGLPTIMSRDLNERVLLASGGEILVSATDVNGNIPLDLLNPLSVTISADVTNTSGQDMGLFELSNVEAPFWSPIPSLDSARFAVNEGENKYRFLIHDLKWYNVDKIENTFPNTVKVTYLLPLNFNESQFRLLVNIPALPNSIADYSTELPLGEKCQLFLIQHKEDGFLFGHKDFKVERNQLVDISTIQLIKGDEADLRQYVHGLVE